MTWCSGLMAYAISARPCYHPRHRTDEGNTGDFTDALGLPIAADTGLNTLAAGLAYEVVNTAITQITADFSGLF